METTEPRLINKSQKSYMCEWCYEKILIGTSYWKWFTYGENVTARMHPECYNAMLQADLYDDELPPAGTYRRGCWCDEKNCVCRTEEREKC